VYSLTYHLDVLGPGDARAQQARLRPVAEPIAGDIAAVGPYRVSGSPTQYTTIYFGDGKVAAPFQPGTGVRLLKVDDLGQPVTYWRL
jgi:hypothetical protein